jgi:hypothetical protein
MAARSLTVPKATFACSIEYPAAKGRYAGPIPA